MTREEHLVFCEKCTNRKLDLQQGLLCSLTGEKADFEDTCPDFNLDETVKERVIDTEPAEIEDIQRQLSTEAKEKLSLEEDFPKALIGGIAVGLVGAMLWGIITVATGYQIGFMAIAIGAGVGLIMRSLGNGIDPKFGVAGAIIAVSSCALGNFFSLISFLAEAQGMIFFDVLFGFDYSQIGFILSATFSFMDVIFYGIAGYEGYKLAFRTFTEEELADLK